MNKKADTFEIGDIVSWNCGTKIGKIITIKFYKNYAIYLKIKTCSQTEWEGARKVKYATKNEIIEYTLKQLCEEIK